MLNKLFLLYQSDKKQIKLIYQQIDGILADNYVFLTPSLGITLSPLTTNLNYPTLSFTIENDCYSLNYLIKTKPSPLNNLTSSQMTFLSNFYANLVIFIVCNCFSVIVMVFFYIYEKQKKIINKAAVESETYIKTATDDYESANNSLK